MTVQTILTSPPVVPSDPSVSPSQVIPAHATPDAALRQTHVMDYARFLSQLNAFVHTSLHVFQDLAELIAMYAERIYQLEQRVEILRLKLARFSPKDHYLRKKIKKVPLSAPRSIHGDFLLSSPAHPEIVHKYMDSRKRPDFSKLSRYIPDVTLALQAFAYTKRIPEVNINVKRICGIPLIHPKDKEPKKMAPFKGSQADSLNQLSQMDRVKSINRSLQLGFFQSEENVQESAIKKDTAKLSESLNSLSIVKDDEEMEMVLGSVSQRQKQVPMVRHVRLMDLDNEVVSRTPSIHDINEPDIPSKSMTKNASSHLSISTEFGHQPLQPSPIVKSQSTASLGSFTNDIRLSLLADIRERQYKLRKIQQPDRRYDSDLMDSQSDRSP